MPCHEVDEEGSLAEILEVLWGDELLDEHLELEAKVEIGSKVRKRFIMF